MATNGVYSSSDRGSAVEAEVATEAGTTPGGFFMSDLRRHEDLKNMLDSNKDGLKLEAMKRIIGMIAKGKDASDLFPAVVKNVVSKNIEVKKLVYVYLVRYAEEQQDLALLSISTFQRALKDPNQLIRASALRVLSSIRVPVIVPIMMLAIKDAVSDMSPYVRKTAAHAIPKLHDLDPEQRDQLIEVLERLLGDKTTLVVGSAVMAFEEVCPERVDLIHKHYRKLCNLLVDVEEWGQVEIMLMLTRYARSQFLDPNKNLDLGEEDKERPFYEDDSEEEDGKRERVGRRSSSPTHIFDPDHRLLLRSATPLLQSRNAAVVMAVCQLFYHLAPRNEIAGVAKAMVRLLRSHREIQTVVLSNIATMSTTHRGMFEPYLKSFFVRSSDPTQIKLLKLEVLTNLATESNISIILREFQTYVSSSDQEFASATIHSIGRCASSIKEVADTCLSGLVHLLSNRSEGVVGESVVVIKKLLQMQPHKHSDIISHMAKLMDSIQVSMARASILWLIAEYADPKIAPDVLRRIAKTFPQEEDIVKLQALNLASKLILTNQQPQVQLIVHYVYSLAKYDTNYDIRDRVRFLRQLTHAENNKLARYAKTLLLASKPAPVLHSAFSGRDQFQIGSLSHFINARAAGYRELPSFPEVQPDPSVRIVAVSPTVNDSPERRTPSGGKSFKKNASLLTKEKSFYSDEEESSSEDEDSSSSSGNSSSSDSEYVSNQSGSDSESDSESSLSDASSDSERKKKVSPSRKAVNKGSNKISATNGVLYEPATDIAAAGDKDTSDEEKNSPPSTSSDDSDATSSSFDEEETRPPVTATRPKKKTASVAPPKSSGTASNSKSKQQKSVDLLLLDLDLDDNSACGAAVMPPMALQPMAPLVSNQASHSPGGAASGIMPVMTPPYLPVEQRDLVVTPNGLRVRYRYTRMPHLFSDKMTSIELTFINEGKDDISEIGIPDKKSSSIDIRGIPNQVLLAAGQSFSATLGIDFCDSTQQAQFELKYGGAICPVTLKPPVGEIIRAVALSDATFDAERARLSGMQENSTRLQQLKHKGTSVVNKVYKQANTMLVSGNNAGVYRFASQTQHSKSLVLITIKVEESVASLMVNCEKLVVGSMLMQELKTVLEKD